MLEIHRITASVLLNPGLFGRKTNTEDQKLQNKISFKQYLSSQHSQTYI